MKIVHFPDNGDPVTTDIGPAVIDNTEDNNIPTLIDLEPKELWQTHIKIRGHMLYDVQVIWDNGWYAKLEEDPTDDLTSPTK